MSVHDLSDADLIDALDFLIEYFRYGEEGHADVWTDRDPVTQRLTEVLACIFSKGSTHVDVWESLKEFLERQQNQDTLRALKATISICDAQSLDHWSRLLVLVRLLLTANQFVLVFTEFCEGSIKDLYSGPSVVTNEKRRGKVIKYLMRLQTINITFQLDSLPPADVVPGTLADYQIIAYNKKKLYKEKMGLSLSQQSTTSSVASSNVHTSETVQSALPTPIVDLPFISAPTPMPASISTHVPTPDPALVQPKLSLNDKLVLDQHSEIPIKQKITEETPSAIEKPKDLVSTIPVIAIAAPPLAKPANVSTPVNAPPPLVPKISTYSPTQVLSLDKTTDDATLLKSLTKPNTVQRIAGIPVNLSSVQTKMPFSMPTKEPTVVQPMVKGTDVKSLQDFTTAGVETNSDITVSSKYRNTLNEHEPAAVRGVFTRSNILMNENKELLATACPTLKDEMKRIEKKVATIDLSADLAHASVSELWMDVLSEAPMERAVLSDNGSCEIVSFTGRALVTDATDNYWVRLMNFSERNSDLKIDSHSKSINIVPKAPACCSTTFTFNVDHYTFDKIVIATINSTPPLSPEHGTNANTYTYSSINHTRPADIRKVIHTLQEDKCAGCSSLMLGLAPTEVDNLLFCHYTGKIYCQQCSLIINKHIIPAKVLSTKRDVTEYTVGAASFKVLEQYWKQPNIETTHLLSVRLDLDPAFNDCLHKRLKLNKCFDKTSACDDLAPIFQIGEKRAYYYQQHVQSNGTQNFYWSMSDIISLLIHKQLPAVEGLYNKIQMHAESCTKCQSAF